MKWRLWAIACATLIVLPVGGAAQDTATRGVRIGLTYGGAVKPGVVVMPVEPANGDSVRAMLERDFDYSDRFTVVSLDSATLSGLRSRAGRFNYPLFARLGVAVIVAAQPTTEGFQVTAYDVAARRALRSDDFVVGEARNSPDWRMAIHGIADEVERWVLGRRGIAQTRIIFSRGGTLYTVDSDGADLRRLSTVGTAMSPAWHPNGRVIAYSRLGEDGSRIVIQNLDTGARRMVAATSTLNITPSFSPDGNTLIYATGRSGGTEIVAAPVSNPGDARLVTVGRGSDNTSPSYSPDGRRVAFTSGRAGQPEVYIVDADGTNLQLITEFTYGGVSYRASPAWSPDGRYIAYQAQAGGFQLMALSLRDRSVRQLTNEGSNEDPSWAPDGRHLVFTSTRSGTRQLWVIDVESGRLRQLTHASGARLAAWSPILRPDADGPTLTAAPSNDD